MAIDSKYLGRISDFKNSRPNNKTNHNHKEDLGCVPGFLLKCYHKTSMVSLENKTHNMYFALVS